MEDAVIAGRRPGRRVSLWLLALTAAVAVGGYARLLATRPYGTLTAAQVAARMTRLCQVLTPDASSVRVMTAPFTVSSPRRASRRVWMADAFDSRGFAAHAVWDADSGDLLSANQAHCAPKWDAGHKLRRSESLAVARGWLRRLGLDGPNTRWLAADVVGDGSSWTTMWRDHSRDAIISVDGLSGGLEMATVHPVKTAR